MVATAGANAQNDHRLARMSRVAGADGVVNGAHARIAWAFLVGVGGAGMTVVAVLSDAQ